MVEFHSLNLHDAHITNIGLCWESGCLTIEASVFIDGLQKPAIFCKLCWTNLHKLFIPREFPWGPSSFIHSHQFVPPGQYEIEMQSGDTLLIEADKFELIPYP
ncbi:MAG: hypothetical protein HUU50_05445 [Candidatus Brocadiae bacterium]|nr:hypothetical protein [Candidatus Brocadiia bacterium]